MGFGLLSVFQSCSVWPIRGQQMERGDAAAAAAAAAVAVAVEVAVAAAGACQSESSLL